MRTELANQFKYAADTGGAAHSRTDGLDKTGLAEIREQFKHLTDCFLNETEPAFSTTRTDILDHYFQERFAGSLTGIKLDPVNNPYAIIARGNYGRKEIGFQPDVAILFIFSDEIPEKADGLIRDIIYPLWDLDLNITYSIRTVKECVADAKKDFTYLLSVLDSRFVCGASQLFSQLITTIREKIVFSKKKEIAAWQLKQDRQRHKKFNTAEFLLEPDLILSKGGLKDLHSIQSVARSNLNIIELSGLKELNIFSDNNLNALQESADYIRKVVRFLNSKNKNNSRLHVKRQQAAAAFMKYEDTEAESATDLFLSDLCRHMSHIRKAHHRFFLHISPRSFSVLKKEPASGQKVPDWLFKAKGLISFKSARKITEKPLRLLEIFIESERLDMPLNANALRFLNDYHHLLRHPDTDSKTVCDLFERTLFFSKVDSDAPFDILDSELLTTLIPELKYAVYKKTAGYYHFHPFCHHLLLTLNHLKELIHADNALKPYAVDAVILSSDILSLFWAGLLQGLNREAICSVLRRFGKPPRLIETVCFLVKNHNLLYSVVSRENCLSEKTILKCTDQTDSYNKLNRLYLLTIADMKAKGLACGSYKREDLDRLYHSIIESKLDGGTEAESNAPVSDIFLEECLFYKIGNAETVISEIDFNAYLNSFSRNELLLHLTLINEAEEGELVSSAKTTGELRKTTILSKNSIYSLQDIIGIFLKHKIKIYDYRSHYFSETTVIHAFRTEIETDRVYENEKWTRVNEKLKICQAHNLLNTINRSAPYLKKDVSFNSTSSTIDIIETADASTYIVELVSKDSPETLFRVVRELSTDGFDILFFRKTNESSGCLYIFRIVDKSDRLSEPALKKRYCERLIQVATDAERYSKDMDN